jgi:hypothetical protein
MWDAVCWCRLSAWSPVRDVALVDPDDPRARDDTCDECGDTGTPLRKLE